MCCFFILFYSFISYSDNVDAEEATKVWLHEVGLELPGKYMGDSATMKKIRQLTDVGRFLNRLLGEKADGREF